MIAVDRTKRDRVTILILLIVIVLDRDRHRIAPLGSHLISISLIVICTLIVRLRIGGKDRTFSWNQLRILLLVGFSGVAVVLPRCYKTVPKALLLLCCHEIAQK